MTDKQRIIQRIINIVNDNAPNSEVYLYGSQARGDSNIMSDWDLLILLNQKKISFETEAKFMDDFYEIELETGEVISPLIYSKTDWDSKHVITPLFQSIKNEGVRIK